MYEQHPVRFNIGDRVRIIDGRFKGVIGTVARIDETAGELDMMTRLPGIAFPVPIQLPIAQIELEHGPAPST